MKIKYICLSDLHLGAELSLLTGLDDTGLAKPSVASDALISFAESFGALLGTLPVDEDTRLVLLGDVLDMGFSDTANVVKTFRTFAEVFLRSEAFKNISNNIVFIPGNHDHQLWQNVKNHHLLGQIQSDDDIEALMQVTSLVGPEHLESYLLRDIIRSVDSLEDITVQVAYPNLADSSGQRGVVFHHGHYTESLYLTMSKIRKIIDGELLLSSNINQIEQDNGSWINFLWSSLGSAGFGDDSMNMYQTLLDAGATHEFILKSSKKIKAYVIDNFGVIGSSLKSINQNLTIESAAKVLLDVSIGRLASFERGNFLDVLSKDGIDMLTWYLQEPLLAQFKAEQNLPPRQLSFIYGHTHKPFQDRLPVLGYSEPVNVYNTGGWAIDKPVTTSLQGAAAVFVDDSFNVASLRLFNCSPDGEVSSAYAAGSGDPEDANNPLLDSLSMALEASKPEWANFQKIITQSVTERSNYALARYFDPHALDGVHQIR